jgi:hypothetical protein
MMKAVTIKLPHQTEEGTVIVEHFMLALAAKPKKLGVTIFAQTLCGWSGAIKESEFKVHYGSGTPTVNCGGCMDAFLSTEGEAVRLSGPDDLGEPTAENPNVFQRKKPL